MSIEEQSKVDREKMKILLCSPYFDEPKVVKGGINTWGRYIIEYHKQYAKKTMELIPISFDRYSFVGSASLPRRVMSAFGDLLIPTWQTIRQMRKEQPQVVHICTSGSLSLLRDWVLIWFAKRMKIKTIIHFHFGRIPLLAKKNNWEWKLLVKVLEMCSVPVVMNNDSEKTLREENFKNVRFLPNPLGIGALEKISKMQGKKERISRRVLYCGHVLKTKGMVELVEACAKIPNIELRVVGKCMPNIEEELYAIALNYKKDISWLNIVGEVTHNEVIEEMFDTDIFILPSYTEGFPNVILEAMACGCPIIATNVGAIPEMLNIDEDPCGLCIEPQKTEEIYDAINLLLNDEDLKKSFAQKAQKRVNEMYAMPKVWEQLVEIWKE